jgi:hypothetical protein
MVTSVVLTILAGGTQTSKSILDTGKPVPASGTPANQDSGPKKPSVPTSD